MAEPSLPLRLILERTGQFLEQQVAPQMSTRWLMQKAFMSGFVLRLLAVTMEEQSKDLGEENEAMKEALAGVLEVLQRESALSQNQTRDQLIESLDSELRKVNGAALDLSEQNLNLKEALVETIKGLDALTDELPAETLSPLRQQIRSAIRLQLNHSLARLAIVEGSQ